LSQKIGQNTNANKTQKIEFTLGIFSKLIFIESFAKQFNTKAYSYIHKNSNVYCI